ncbi:MAG: hypothetical protein M1822_005984 [Bathelium mastoideum]|nr:MAG: hypothetical protein M1822_005984 [Bathelium mastoideum]
MSITVVFVGGFWEGPGVFDGVRATLYKEHGYNSTTIARLSTGIASPTNPTQSDDIKIIRTALKILADRGNTIVLVVHSAGGFIGTGAVPGLTLTERMAAGLPGGVGKIVGITATLVRGDKLANLPHFFDPREDRLLVKNPESTIFSDISPEAAKPYIDNLLYEPEWHSWDRPPTYGPELFEKVPAMALLCTKDRTTPWEFQKMWADAAKAEIRECDAGHMVQLSQPQAVVDIIKEAAESLVQPTGRV